MNDLISFTIDEYREAKKRGDIKKLEAYNNWRTEQRKQDFREIRRISVRVFQMHNRGKCRRWSREYNARMCDRQYKRGLGIQQCTYLFTVNNRKFFYVAGFDFDGSVFDRIGGSHGIRRKITYDIL